MSDSSKQDVTVQEAGTQNQTTKTTKKGPSISQKSTAETQLL